MTDRRLRTTEPAPAVPPARPRLRAAVERGPGQSDDVVQNVSYLNVDEGHLQVVDHHDRLLAIYAPGRWVSAKVLDDGEAPTGPKV